MSFKRVANHLASFYFRTIGCLAHNLELVTSGRAPYYRFRLTSHDYTENGQGRFKVEFQSLRFVTSQAIGALIAAGARQGDQLFVEGEIHEHHWTAKSSQEVTFVVTAFQFGTRRPPGFPAPSISAAPPKPFEPEAEAAAANTYCKAVRRL
jgi:single-stranded DNA-binding protein